MKKIEDFKEKRLVKLQLSRLPEEKQNFLIFMIDNFPDTFTTSKKIGRLKVYFDIISNNITDYGKLIEEYYEIKSTLRKLEIRKGTEYSAAYSEKLKLRPRHKIFNILTVEYWIVKKGFTEKEAIDKISKMQKNTALKRSKTSYTNFSLKLKHSIDYWTNIGYSEDEAIILRKPYLSLCTNDLQTLIERHGEDIAHSKWNSRAAKYKISMQKAMSSKRTGGYVSKESLKFFIPLYKFCRKIGIPRKEIYFGISGSREFFIRDNSKYVNSGKFYDFTISKLKIIVEYHGIFWHAKDDPVEWKNPWVDYYTSLDSDYYKQQLAENFGMEYIVVWSDEHKIAKLEILKSKIIDKWEKYNETNVI